MGPRLMRLTTIGTPAARHVVRACGREGDPHWRVPNAAPRVYSFMYKPGFVSQKKEGLALSQVLRSSAIAGGGFEPPTSGL